jgi:DNA repair exonuclease SbcCD ATPase subunit
MMGGGLEEIIKELSSLARRKPLKEEDLGRAKELMIKLKEMGFTNAEISELTGGGWSEPTIKSYTRGAAVKDLSPKEVALGTLTRMVDAGLKLEDVEVAISVKKTLEAKGVGLEDVSEFLSEVKKSGVALSDLLQTYKALRDSGLAIAQLSEALTYKSRLDEVGLTIEGLKEVYKASEACGGFEGLVKAVNTYGSLQAMEAELSRLRSEKEGVEKRLSELKEEVARLDEEKSRVEGALRLYEELRKAGFEEDVLRGLKEASDKYGGVKGVIEAVKTYGSLTDLKSVLEELEERKSSVEAELKKLEADRAHLQTVIDMCDKLLYELKFSVPAITEVYEIAKRYGEPVEVLKAVGRYGELKAIEEDVEELTAKKRELESRIKELSTQVQERRGLIDELRRTARGLLEPFVKELSKDVELLGRKFSDAVDAISSKYEEYARRYGELKAECGKLEEELRLARVIQALIKYPSELKELPLDYDIQMLRAVMNHCRIKGVNPRVRVLKTVSDKYKINPYTAVELLDLLEWAITGLEGSLAPGGRS